MYTKYVCIFLILHNVFITLLFIIITYKLETNVTLNLDGFF